MKLCYALLFTVFLANIINAQSVPDSEFQWQDNSTCIVGQMSSPIFAKVEIDPLVTQMNKIEFETFCEQIVDRMAFQSNVNGILKLKILFHRDQFVMTHKIGSKGIDLTEDQLSVINKYFKEITEFLPGKQRGKQVNCLGIVYFYIKNSKLDMSSTVNLDLINDL